MTQIKLGIGIPAYGGKVSVEHTRMWLEVGAALADNRERFTLTLPLAHIDVCQVDKARGLLIDAAIEAKCDWLLMLDADTYVEDGVQLLQMISSADRDGFVAAVAPVLRRSAEGARRPEEFAAYVDGEPLAYSELVGGHRDLIPIDEAGAACMAIKVSWVYARLRDDQPWFRFTKYRSEDRDFCQRVRQAGGSIACDRRVRTRHVNKPGVLRWDGA